MQMTLYTAHEADSDRMAMLVIFYNGVLPYAWYGFTDGEPIYSEHISRQDANDLLKHWGEQGLTVTKVGH